MRALRGEMQGDQSAGHRPALAMAVPGRAFGQPLDHGDRPPGKPLCAQALSALPGPGLRGRLPRRGAAPNPRRGCDLRCLGLSGLPVLHERLSLWNPPARYNWESARPAIQKCNLCHPRTLKGKKPGCVEVCPTEATLFGDREELLAEAKRRLRAEPNRYIQKVWGEHWVGGTSVLYISDIDVSFLGWKKELGNLPLPQLTWNILAKMPPIFLSIGGLMAGIYWLYERKNKIQRETRQNPGTKAGPKK